MTLPAWIFPVLMGLTLLLLGISILKSRPIKPFESDDLISWILVFLTLLIVGLFVIFYGIHLIGGGGAITVTIRRF